MSLVDRVRTSIESALRRLAEEGALGADGARAIAEAARWTVYHSDKLSRGSDRIIDVWGADHHGYVPRMKNVLDALGQVRNPHLSDGRRPVRRRGREVEQARRQRRDASALGAIGISAPKRMDLPQAADDETSG
jgi:hypothetical protein